MADVTPALNYILARRFERPPFPHHRRTLSSLCPWPHLPTLALGIRSHLSWTQDVYISCLLPLHIGSLFFLLPVLQLPGRTLNQSIEIQPEH